jgi:hypothetical protein
MASEGKAAPEAATVKPVEEAAPATTSAELSKAQEAQAEAAAPAVTATNGNGVHAVKSEPMEKDIEGLREPSQKVFSPSRAESHD